MPKYTIRQSYITQDIYKNVEAKDKQEAIDICMGGKAVDETRHEETITEAELEEA